MTSDAPQQRRALNRTARGFAILLASVSVTACASLVKPTDVAPMVETSVPVEADWAEPAPEALPRTDWVESFGDEALVALVARGDAQNPSVRRAIAQLDAALARQQISRADLYPQLNYSGRVQQNEGGTGFFAGSRTYNIGIQADWEADLFGRIRDQIVANGEAIQASAADVAALRLSVASRIATAWFNAIEAELLVDLSSRDIDTQERSLRLTERRFESGLTGSSDVRLARSNLASSQALEQLRIQNRNAAVRTLQTLVRAYPDARVDLPAALPNLPAFTGAGTPQLMLARRPDILAAEARVAEAGFNVDVARKALYPRLNITGSIGDETINSSNPQGPNGDILDLFDLQELAYSLAASITGPIFQGGRLRGQVEAQRAQLAAQIETYAETVLTAYQEVENALDAEELLEAREAALRVSLDEAQLAENRLELRYTEGLATILQLLDAQTRRLNAEGQLIGAQAERLSNRVRLHVALGGSGYTPLPAIEAADDRPPLFPDIGDILP